MGILERVMTVLKANLNDLINRAENPEKMLNQILLDMQEQLAKAKQEVAAAIADEKRLEQQYRNEVEQAREWERKARLAVEKENDELAKEALRRQAEHERYGLDYKKQWERQKESTEKLRTALQALNRKIEEARRKKTLLVARQRRAEAQKRIHDTMTGLTDTSAFDTFERMAAKVEQVEAEAAASAELSEELTGEALEKRFAELEAGQDVEQALAALKAKMGKTSGAP
ncbi:MAG: PspA/IM30 family protein [candidate division NC10 bacterium]|nr:PspA/IM30 family protein [candidate division NC10 bacterium]